MDNGLLCSIYCIKFAIKLHTYGNWPSIKFIYKMSRNEQDRF